jgi:non-specific serine/threonine protein kinase
MHNLTPQLSSFIGRQKEIAELKNLLAHNRVRLLTLVGAGGCGKTRLSLQVGAGVLESFQDGVWFVELAPLTDPALIAPTIAGALGLSEQAGQPVLTTLGQYLSSRQLLLVLDNCEHLLEECLRLVDTLLRASLNLQIMASSREVLGLNGEITFLVPSLSLPDPHELPELAKLTDYEAVRLFMERAGAVNPHWTLTQANAPAVVSLCRHLDGIPLAIELAAARMTVLTVEQVTARLGDRFRLLTGGSRAVVPRQQTLRALVDWSYGLLSGAEKRLLACLSVFAGGWTLEAAIAVAGKGENGQDVDEYAVLEALSGLVNKSLAQVSEGKNSAGVRYSFLETLRQYGLEKLKESREEEKDVRDRHLAYYLDLAEQADRGLQGSKQAGWLERLELEIDNLRAALDWAFDEPPLPPEGHEVGPAKPEARLRLPLALSYFWQIKGYQLEWKHWLEKALAETAPEPPSRWRSLALAMSGMAAAYRYELALVESSGQASLKMAKQVGDKYCEAMALRVLGLGIAGESYGTGATKNYDLVEQSLALFRVSGAKWEMGQVLRLMQSIAVMMQYDDAKGLALAEEQLALSVEIGDLWGQTQILSSLTIFYTGLGKFDRSREFFERSKSLLAQSGNQPDLASILKDLGMAARFQGNHKEAANLLRQSLAILQINQIPSKVEVAGLSGNLAFVEIELGHYRTAWNLLEQSFECHQELRLLGGSAWNMEGFAMLALALEKPQWAARLFGNAEIYREKTKTPMHQNDWPIYRQKMEILKKKLNSVTLETLWAEGRVMSIEEAFSAAQTYLLTPGLANLIATHEPGPADGKAISDEIGQKVAASKKGQLLELTGREVEVLRLVAKGLTNAQVAEKLVLSPLTVNAYLRTIYSKLTVTTRTAAVHLALESGLI